MDLSLLLWVDQIVYYFYLKKGWKVFFVAKNYLPSEQFISVKNFSTHGGNFHFFAF